ncbi:zinc ribbon domain-containing protein [Streptomyces sp. NPDC005795]|uniref:zinc ribbon domain-containing protein n=1 Tax=Streptomyces sp. NPDC005795 TaxID=3154677 RepID=UPI0033D98001
MAMVACRECGHRVSDGAQICPACGIDSPGGVTQMEIKRVSRLTGSLVPMAVWIDSNHVGTLTSGKSLTYTVAPGIHRVECGLQQAGNKDGAQEFDVPAGRRLVIVVSPSKWNGKPSFSAELA